MDNAKNAPTHVIITSTCLSAIVVPIKSKDSSIKSSIVFGGVASSVIFSRFVYWFALSKDYSAERQSALTPDRERGSQHEQGGKTMNVGTEGGSGVDATRLVRCSSFEIPEDDILRSQEINAGAIKGILTVHLRPGLTAEEREQGRRHLEEAVERAGSLEAHLRNVVSNRRKETGVARK